MICAECDWNDKERACCIRMGCHVADNDDCTNAWFAWLIDKEET